MKLRDVILAACLLLPNLAIAPPGAFAKDRAAESRWEVDYGPNSCRLIRHFANAGKSYRLEVRQNLASGGQSWGLLGTGLPTYSSEASIEVATGSDVSSRRFQILSFLNRDTDEKAIRWDDVDGVLLGALREDQPLRITDPKKFNIAVKLPKVTAAVDALKKCENDLFGSWGFDAIQYRSLVDWVQPSNYPGRWVTNDDYPRADAASMNEGTTMFLLTVGADGTPVDCRVIESSGFPSLDARTCQLLMARAVFHPAKDRTGQAAKGFYVNRIRWQVPR